MGYKRKTIIFTSIVAVVMAVLIVFLNTPTKVLEYKSSDGDIVVTIVTSKTFAPTPSRVQDYTLIVKQKESIFSKVILKRDFTFHADCSGIGKEFVNVEWNDNSVIITIDSEEMNKKSFEAAW